MRNTRTGITPKMLKEHYNTINAVNAEGLHEYTLNFSPEKLTNVMGRLLIYAIENQDRIYLSREDTDELKGLLYLLGMIQQGKEEHELLQEK